MAFIDYPPELRQTWLVSGFRTARDDRRVWAQPSRGRAWSRRGASVHGGRPVSALTRESVSNLARFWRFYEEELEDGRLPFRVRNQQIDGQPVGTEGLAPITTELGAPVLIAAYWLCRFEAPPEEAPLPNDLDWQLSYQLLIVAG